jgi:hypothetical protein
MRVFALATVLLLSASVIPALAQQAEKAPDSGRVQAVPVQPERTPQQAEQAREQERQQAEDVKIGSDWRARESDSNRMQEKTGPTTDQDNRTVGQDWRVHEK